MNVALEDSSSGAVLGGALIAGLGCVTGALGDIFIRFSHIIRSDQNQALEGAVPAVPPVVTEAIEGSEEEDDATAEAAAPEPPGCGPYFLRFLLGRLRYVLKYPLTRPRYGLLWRKFIGRRRSIESDGWNVWFGGMLMVCVLQPLLITTALLFTPSCIVVAMSAVSLSASLFAAVIGLGEVLVAGGALGALMIVIGLLGLVNSYYGELDRAPMPSDLVMPGTNPTFEDLRRKLESGTAFIYVFGVLIFALINALIAVRWRRSRTFPDQAPVANNVPPGITRCHHSGDDGTTPVAKLLKPSEQTIKECAFAMTAGAMSGSATVSGKLCLCLLREALTPSLLTFTSGGHPPLAVPLGQAPSWSLMTFAFSFLFVSVLGSIWSVNASLRCGRALVIIPVRNTVNVILGTAGGYMLLAERPRNVGLSIRSLGIICFGVALTALTQRKVIHPRNPSSPVAAPVSPARASAPVSWAPRLQFASLFKSTDSSASGGAASTFVAGSPSIQLELGGGSPSPPLPPATATDRKPPAADSLSTSPSLTPSPLEIVVTVGTGPDDQL